MVWGSAKGEIHISELVSHIGWKYKDPVFFRTYAKGLLVAGWKGDLSDLILVSDNDRLSERDIKDLFQTRVMVMNRLSSKIGFRYESDGKLLWIGAYQKGRFSPLKFEKVGAYWIEEGMLCEKMEKKTGLLPSGFNICGFVYRYPNRSRETVNSYIWQTWTPAFFTPAPVEVVRQAESERRQGLAARTGIVKKNRFIRTSSPSLSFDIPKGFKETKEFLQQNIVFGARFTQGSPKTLAIIVFPVGNVEADLAFEAFEENMQKIVARWGKGYKFLSDEPVDKYGEYPARRFIYEWLYMKRWPSITYNHAIKKGDHIVVIAIIAGKKISYEKREAIIDSMNLEF